MSADVAKAANRSLFGDRTVGDVDLAHTAGRRTDVGGPIDTESDGKHAQKIGGGARRAG